MSAARGTVLVSGASVAGLTVAHWLHRYGFAVTVVERARAPRSGGYPIDVRGTAAEVARRTGILPRLREADIASRRMTFLEGDGAEVAVVHPQAVAGGVEGRDVEVARGRLTEALHDTVRDDVELLFADSIDTLAEHEHGVDVTFRGGGRRTFDVVVGADGLHSHTRALTLGPEEQFHRYLGYCFGIFTVPNTEGLSREVVMWNAPGRAAALYATRADEPLHAFLNVAVPEPPLALLRDPAAQHALLADRFAGDGWRVPGMVAAARESDDLFFDTVSQVRMPRWSSGRVVLTGDAAHAPSFLTGQGTSLALVGAYMLARSLATQPDHTAAFAAYERDTRGFVELNQAQVGRGDTALFPVTAEDLERRNARLRGLAGPAPRNGSAPRNGRPAHTALTLPPEPLVRRAVARTVPRGTALP